ALFYAGLAGCLVEDAPLAGKACPCVDGEYCVAGRCTPSPPQSCASDTDCPGVENACAHRRCAAGSCIQNFEAAGVVGAGSAKHGHCTSKVCDGAGNPQDVANSDDIPEDGNECTDDRCDASGPKNDPFTGTPCAQGVGSICSAGKCVECLKDVDCGTTG